MIFYKSDREKVLIYILQTIKVRQLFIYFAKIIITQGVKVLLEEFYKQATSPHQLYKRSNFTKNCRRKK
ncbi:MAG UNVERIFIED_CONTAM: hypothetical protein LVQ98_06195 [Rickettsiaceae bacterium]